MTATMRMKFNLDVRARSFNDCLNFYFMSFNEEVALIIEELDSSRKKIKKEIQENHSILEKNESNMHDKLVDKDGFPRNDLDLVAIRTARNKITCLSNDLEVLNEKIYKELPSYYGKNEEEDFQKLCPFLVVDSVEEDSPAFTSVFYEN
uniref:Putative 26S proteasome non-ATPase regulatory subunit 9 (Trinotate prediction) n=1 Tax=Myxobolus squamalis TaxID=59785 RepID=A0A6B2G879_MYXSQ